MKKVEKIEELSVGEKIYIRDDMKIKEFIIRSLEDKLVPYVITTDNSSHSLRKGIWIEK